MPIMHGLQHRHPLLYTSKVFECVGRIRSSTMLRQLCLGRFLPIAEQYLLVLGRLGARSAVPDHWRHTSLKHWHCTVLQAMSGWIRHCISSVWFHLKGLRRNCPLHPGLPPFPLLCPNLLHTNCVVYMKSLQVSAPGWCSERSPLAMGQCIQVSTWLRQWASLILAGLVFRLSVGVLRILSRAIYGSPPQFVASSVSSSHFPQLLPLHPSLDCCLG